jgi:hypothetical protein
VGNGGIGADEVSSNSWHNRTDESEAREACPAHRRPHYVPDDFDPTRYSATYHTDVLVPTRVTTDGSAVKGDYEEPSTEIWSYLILDYITTAEFPADHVNYGLFHGHPVEDCARYHNPWPARVAHNEELFQY